MSDLLPLEYENSQIKAAVVKTLTRKQIESRREKAERFVRDVLGDPERADEIADESLDDYAARRKIKILDNPRRIMRQSLRAVDSHERGDVPNKKELMERIKELRGYRSSIPPTTKCLYCARVTEHLQDGRSRVGGGALAR